MYWKRELVDYALALSLTLTAVLALVESLTR